MAQFIPRMLFALAEEWGWRGYLEPRLTALHVPDVPRHLFVGVIWALWHFPLILSTDYTTMPYFIFLPLFVIGVVVAAIVYGQLRKKKWNHMDSGVNAWGRQYGGMGHPAKQLGHHSA